MRENKEPIPTKILRLMLHRFIGYIPITRKAAIQETVMYNNRPNISFGMIKSLRYLLLSTIEQLFPRIQTGFSSAILLRIR